MGPTGCDTEGTRGTGEDGGGGGAKRSSKREKRGGGGADGTAPIALASRDHAVVADGNGVRCDRGGGVRWQGHAAKAGAAWSCARQSAPARVGIKRGGARVTAASAEPSSPTSATDASVEIQGAPQIFCSWTGPSRVEWTPPPIHLCAGGGPPSSPLHCRARRRRRGRLATRRWGRWPRRTRGVRVLPRPACRQAASAGLPPRPAVAPPLRVETAAPRGGAVPLCPDPVAVARRHSSAPLRLQHPSCTCPASRFAATRRWIG